MGARKNFWSELHVLATAIETQGHDPTQRINAIASAFDELMPVSKQDVRTDLAFVISELQTLQAHITVASAAARRQLTV
jgi:hypothetical protein